MRLFEFEEALNMFAEDKQIDLIIAIQKNHSFMEEFIPGAVTYKLMSYQRRSWSYME